MDPKNNLWGVDLTLETSEIIKQVRNEIADTRSKLRGLRLERKCYVEPLSDVEGMLTGCLVYLYDTLQRVEENEEREFKEICVWIDKFNMDAGATIGGITLGDKATKLGVAREIKKSLEDIMLNKPEPLVFDNND